MRKLRAMGIVEELLKYIKQNRPFMGICVGMQALFEGSTEESSESGLGIVGGMVQKFNTEKKSVPQIGWNMAHSLYESEFVDRNQRYYFVHSYAVLIDGPDQLNEWTHTLTTYGDQTFVSSIQRGNIFATQFHPEKSGAAGLRLFERFLKASSLEPCVRTPTYMVPKDMLSKRIIACLDVRTNDHGDLVVTKGDQYDVRETAGNVRNLGKPVELASRYYNEGADEITFLNITSFRSMVLEDNLMLQVLRSTSKNVFVPLTIGGGIRDIKKENGEVISAVEVAGEYFRSGADKVSIGSEAVYIAERYLNEKVRFKNTITSISEVYGAQAVVISVDPKRVYVSSTKDTNHSTVESVYPGPNGEKYWYNSI
jgi:glutamine amidotransferase/cyclase